MKFSLRTILVCFTVCIFTLTALKAQNFQLIGLIDNKLVLIDSLTGALQAQATIDNISLADHVNLTYHYEKDLYYTIMSPNEAPKLVSITKEGDYQIIGTLMYNGNPVPLCDALAYNPVRKKLYAGASLNGGVLQNDFYTESIVEIDPDTGVCSLITTISTNLPLPDIDVMAFEGDVMYFFDGAPPGANFLYFYRLDFANLGVVSFPQIIYQSTYIAIEDFTVTSQNIYFTEGRNLRRFNLSTGTLHLVGTTHTFTQYNGKLIRGIGKLLTCPPPIVDLGKDRIVCDTEELILVAPFYNNTNYLWSTGAIEPTVTINQTGTYSIEIFNDCGSAQDTVNIKFSIGGIPFIPNVFTPNGDYKNESFEIDAVLMGSSLKVFNRWGKLVFESANYLGDWQAEEVASGIYYYTLRDHCYKEYRGSITIIH